ncbi:hypothetical protein ACVBEG_27070 [Pseudomonas sp. GG8]
MSVTFALAYAANQLQIPRGDVLNAITAGAALSLITMPLSGALSDKVRATSLVLAAITCFAHSSTRSSPCSNTRPLLVWSADGLDDRVVLPILLRLNRCCWPGNSRRNGCSGISVPVQLAGVSGGWRR